MSVGVWGVTMMVTMVVFMFLVVISVTTAAASTDLSLSKRKLGKDFMNDMCRRLAADWAMVTARCPLMNTFEVEFVLAREEERPLGGFDLL